MIRLYSKSVWTVVLHLFTVQLLLYSASSADDNNSTDNTPSGAEFLKSVIGNLHRPNRKVFNARIDVNEYIPNDASHTSPGNELKILSRQPTNFMAQQKSHTNMNRPTPLADANNNNQGEKMAMFASQMAPQFMKNEFSDSQHKIVSQGPPQQISSVPPSNFLSPNLIEALSSESVKPDGTINGYNYFFYPLDNEALQQLQQQQQSQQQIQQYNNANNHEMQQQQQDNSMAGGGDQDNHAMTKPKVEPLFVAMAGFVGVAVVFLSALMFIPRLPIPVLGTKAALKRAPEELATLTRLVAESIDGKDCTERIACEVGRAMRSMQLDNKPIRMMEIILPPAVAKQLAQVRRSASRKEQCHFIMCKKTEGTLKMVAKLKKTNNNANTKTIHDVKEIFKLQ
ncbi:WD40/YVTN repeat-like-containing domain [Cinara cedri]|uniref:WD40/YVTN repeat-like-containing domain n=1 Tax=Cinara cedri TaxID=506608 RepID=A0A5E4NGB2_9HEMI|nr:WD40/YVTN repeat-like-containing domain [Cinara cedri]